MPCAGPKEPAVEASACADALMDSTDAWGRMAQRLLADIPEQPSGLTAGRLRDYQMHVSWRFAAWAGTMPPMLGAQLQLIILY